MESEWLTYAKRLQAIAATGLHFCRDDYDRERYDEVGRIATEMLGALGSVPIERIAGLVSVSAEGYATPKVDVRGAVIRDDRILLVRERTDDRWSLPGGFADIGLSAAANVEKEVHEEAGLKVAALRLYGMRHKAAAGYAPDVRDFYKLFFLCERRDDGEPVARAETRDARYFAPDALPPLSRGRVLEEDIAAAFASHRDVAKPAFFD